MRMLESVVEDVLISTASKQAVMAEVILNSGRGAEDASFFPVGGVVVFDRTSSLPLKLSHDGEVCDFYIIKNSDISAHVTVEAD